MENILLNIDNELTKGEYFTYFLNEIIYLITIFLNLFLYVFLKRKDNTKRLSDFLTGSALAVNVLILTVLSCKSHFSDNIDFFFLKDLLHYDFNSLILKLVFCIFGMLFLLSTYKISRKTRIKSSLLNAILIIILLIFDFLACSFDFIVTYLLLEIFVFFVYKYASASRIRKYGVYSAEFLALSGSATFLFITSFISGLFVKDLVQNMIVSVCLTLAILLKIGIFPLYNYLIDKNYKNNIPYAIMLSSFLPFAGVVSFSKLIQRFDLFNEIYQIPIIVFLIASLLCFAIFLLRQKNIVSFLAAIGYCFAAFCATNIVLVGQDNLGIKLSCFVSFAVLALFSLVCILKLNLNPEKFDISVLSGIFVHNRYFALLFSVLLLCICGIIPNGILSADLDILKNIYVFDKIGIYVAIAAIFVNLSMAFNSFSIIKTCYMFDIGLKVPKYKKGTIFNYIVPSLVILFLIISFLL